MRGYFFAVVIEKPETQTLQGILGYNRLRANDMRHVADDLLEEAKLQEAKEEKGEK